MTYEFFFSYSRGNSTDYLKKIFDDLSEELREQKGYNKDTVVGFFDQRQIELGEDWDAKIAQALQHARVMICIYSPGYFNSPYCGKEWQVFYSRTQAYQADQRQSGVLNPALPPVIIPILWIAPVPPYLDAKISIPQYTTGDPADAHNKMGLKYILQKLNDYNSFYRDYIRELATKIRTAGEYNVPPLAQMPVLKSVVPPFPRAGKSAALTTATTNSPLHDPRHVRFVFVAADPNKFGALRSKEAYLEAGGSDWRPFEGMRSIGPFLQNLVSNEEIGFESDKLDLGSNLLQEVEKAYDERKIIIFLIDPWTLNWNPEVQTILKKFDKEIKPYLINWSILIPCNEQDLDFTRQRSAIEQTLQDTFYYRANIIKNPTFYRDSIKSVNELRSAICEILINIKAELHKTAQVERKLSNDIAKPVISNQISQPQ